MWVLRNVQMLLTKVSSLPILLSVLKSPERPAMKCKTVSATDLWSTSQLSPAMLCATFVHGATLVAVFDASGSWQRSHLLGRHSWRAKGTVLSRLSLCHPSPIPQVLLHLSGVRWTWGAKVRPLRKKECAFLNKADKCVPAVETDLSYMALQFLCFGKIALPPLHSKMSKDAAVQGGVASFWALQRPVSITCVLMIYAETQALTQSSMNP